MTELSNMGKVGLTVQLLEASGYGHEDSCNVAWTIHRTAKHHRCGITTGLVNAAMDECNAVYSPFGDDYVVVEHIVQIWNDQLTDLEAELGITGATA